MLRSFMVVAACCAGLAVLAVPGRALAQDGTATNPESPAPRRPDGAGGSDPPATGASEQPPANRVTAGWRDGFVVSSDDGAFRLQIGVLLHADARVVRPDDDEAVIDTFLVRRLRPYLRGRLSERFEFFVNPDFAGGTLTVQDAYIDTVFAPALRIRLGKAKTPFGLERLQPASNLLFYDRALPTTLVPNRDVGVQVLGDIAGGRISYLAGLMNGVTDGASADLDTADSKDVAGRLVVRPFAAEAASPLRGFGVAMSASAGPQTAAATLPTLRTPAAQQPYFSYANASPDGTRTRYSPQVFYYHKAFGGFAEYVHSAAPIRRGPVREDIAHDAWEVSGSIVLTGETATDSAAGVRPRADFDFGHGHFGAFQLAARYHRLKVDDRAFTLGFAAPGASRTAEGWTLGVNWYLTPQLRYVFNLERTVFDGDTDAARAPENALVFRTQVYF